IDVDLLRRDGLPAGGRPAVDALLLDRVHDTADAVRWQTELQALWGTPVIGWMEHATALRAAIDRLPAGLCPQKELCQALGKRLAGNIRLDRLWNLAARGPLPEVSTNYPFECISRRKLHVAVALDEDFSCHFPDTLDALEGVGAVV